VRPRKLHENAPGAFVHLVEVGADHLALAIALAGDLFLVGKHAGSPADIHENSAALHSLHTSGHHVALAAAEFVHNGDLFSFPELLNDDLLGGLGGDAAVVFLGFERENELVAELSVLLDLPGVFNEDMLLRVPLFAFILRVNGCFIFFLAFFDHADHGVVDDYFHLEKLGLSGRKVEIHFYQLIFLAVLFFVCGSQRQFYGLENFLPGDAFFFFKLGEYRMDEFKVEHSVRGRPGCLTRNLHTALLSHIRFRLLKNNARRGRRTDRASLANGPELSTEKIDNGRRRF
jgi:hypothetical protein